MLEILFWSSVGAPQFGDTLFRVGSMGNRKATPWRRCKAKRPCQAKPNILHLHFKLEAQKSSMIPGSRPDTLPKLPFGSWPWPLPFSLSRDSGLEDNADVSVSLAAARQDWHHRKAKLQDLSPPWPYARQTMTRFGRRPG